MLRRRSCSPAWELWCAWRRRRVFGDTKWRMTFQPSIRRLKSGTGRLDFKHPYTARLYASENLHEFCSLLDPVFTRMSYRVIRHGLSSPSTLHGQPDCFRKRTCPCCVPRSGITVCDEEQRVRTSMNGHARGTCAKVCKGARDYSTRLTHCMPRIVLKTEFVISSLLVVLLIPLIAQALRYA